MKYIADAIIIATALHSNSKNYNTMASLDNVLAPLILDWIYSKGFDKVTIPDEIPEAILNIVLCYKCKRI